jgi:chorismate synthase
MSIEGRHDPCVVIRAVPVINAAVAVCLLDMMM